MMEVQEEQFGGEKEDIFECGAVCTLIVDHKRLKMKERKILHKFYFYIFNIIH